MPTVCTDAPDAYDGFGSVSQPTDYVRRTYGGQTLTVRLVNTLPEHHTWQMFRYASGSYLRLTPEQLADPDERHAYRIERALPEIGSPAFHRQHSPLPATPAEVQANERAIEHDRAYLDSHRQPPAGADPPDPISNPHGWSAAERYEAGHFSHDPPDIHDPDYAAWARYNGISLGAPTSEWDWNVSHDDPAWP